jgi:NADPH:quinone reductase-like Zn-dependent oxidoreductase
MKAVTFRTYGAPIDVCRIEDLPIPEPGPDDVLVRVLAASINAADWRMIHGSPWPARFVYGGPFRPRRIVAGSDMCGVIERVGTSVRAFGPGDIVMAELALVGMGAFAEYAVAPASALVRAPARISPEAAATLPMAGMTALQGLRDHAAIRAGEHVLVTGAAGGVGSFAVQIAKALGAEVTAICKSEGVRAVASLGADRVIDREIDDPLHRSERYDVVFDCASYRPPTDYVPVMKPSGRYVYIGGSIPNLARVMFMQAVGRKPHGVSVTNYLEKASVGDLSMIRDMADAGTIRPLIDSVVTLDDVPTALDRVEHGKAVGKVIITPDGSRQGYLPGTI